MTQEDRNLLNKLYVDTYNHISMSNYKTRNKYLGTVYLKPSNTSFIITDILSIEQELLMFVKKIHRSKVNKSIRDYLYNLDSRYQTLLKTVDVKEFIDTIKEIEENTKKVSK